MTKRDYYEVLGIDRDADQTAIKKAYRGLAMQYHPDRNPGDAEAVERMKEVNEAYAVLSDEHKRRLYDTYGHASLEGYTQEGIFRGVDFASLFREFGLGDVFGFGGKVEAPGLDGTVTVDVPEATQTGTAFRIMEQGGPRLKGQGRGDQYVIVKVLTPTDLSDEERELLRQFERLRQDSQAQSPVPNDDGRDASASDGEQ